MSLIVLERVTTQSCGGEVLSAKGPAVSDGPLVVININRGTNKASFADQGHDVNITIDRLDFVQTLA
jgi:hypothetical protein